MTAGLNGPVRPAAKMDPVAAVGGYLFAERGAQVYAILDGASVEGLLDSLYRFEPEHVCLYRGEIGPDLAEVAPYLVRLDPKSAFTDWVIGKGWGNHWGIFAVSRADLSTMRRHLRRFLTVHDTAGKPMLFRYYDPRVLRVFLPTCTAAELEEFFGPALCYVLEDEEPKDLLRFQVAGGVLSQQKKPLEQEG